MKNFASYKTIENRAAGIADTVQRGLGISNKQFAKIDTKGKSRK